MTIWLFERVETILMWQTTVTIAVRAGCWPDLEAGPRLCLIMRSLYIQTNPWYDKTGSGRQGLIMWSLHASTHAYVRGFSRFPNQPKGIARQNMDWNWPIGQNLEAYAKDKSYYSRCGLFVPRLDFRQYDDDIWFWGSLGHKPIQSDHHDFNDDDDGYTRCM